MKLAFVAGHGTNLPQRLGYLQEQSTTSAMVFVVLVRMLPRQ